jgi:chemotaxis protein methyltransferase CheR
MKRESFESVARALRRGAGFNLKGDMAYLVEMRLAPVARRHNLRDIDALAHAARDGRNERIVADVVDAMMMKDTAFFRDWRPFVAFRQTILPGLAQARRGAGAETLRIWCAGCATGQEPYSIAMILREEAARLGGQKFEIIASDISETSLARAKAAYFSQLDVQHGMPTRLLIKHFRQEGTGWRLGLSVRNAVRFERFNLIESPRALGAFDVVFCRNVLDHFGDDERREALLQIAAILADDGVLFLGEREDITGAAHAFERLPGAGIFARASHQAARRVAGSAA